ncbi:MAG TPA: hypothetical protein VGO80_00155 [Solirubrobacteraceae bacterium]|nr:hypothetical protein [Solirubrobacteraceae bacterium]
MSDPVADDVASDLPALLEHGVVRFLGYVKVDPILETFRLYTSPTFDHWLEIERHAVQAQLGPSFQSQGRSYIWVMADAVVTKCQSATAAFVSQAADAGFDDPTAFPHG